MKKALERLNRDSSAFFQSLAETKEAKHPELDADGIANFALEFASDHMLALLLLATPPVLPIACATTVRSMLEMSAIGVWLIDTSVSQNERRKRLLAYRFRGIQEQLKLLSQMKDVSDVNPSVEANLRMERLANLAIKDGFEVNRRQDKIVSVGMMMPSATDLIGQMLNLDLSYRALSGAAHGHFWAISTLCYEFSPAETTQDQPSSRLINLDKVARPEVIWAQKQIVFDVFTKLSWEVAKFRGGDLLAFEEILEAAADSFGCERERRFWRSQG